MSPAERALADVGRFTSDPAQRTPVTTGWAASVQTNMVDDANTIKPFLLFIAFPRCLSGRSIIGS